MKRRQVLLILGVLFFLIYRFTFADEVTDKKEEAIALALKEEAMREALQKVESNALSEEIEMGGPSSGFSFRPSFYLDSDVIYNDNIWHVADNVKSDLWLYFNPEIKLALGNFVEVYSNRLKQQIELDLGAQITHSFFRSVALNREAPYGRLVYDLDGGKNKLRFSQDYMRGYDLTSSLIENAEGLSGYQGGNTDINWEYSFNRFGLGLGYRRTAKDYYKEYKVTNSFVDNVGSVSGFLKLTPKTRVFLEYDFGRYEYSEALTDINDYSYSMLWVGVNGQITRKLLGLFKVGLDDYAYSGGVTKDNMMTMKANLQYKQSSKNTFFLDLSFGNASTGYVDLGIDEQHSVKLGLLREFNNKLSFTGNFSYASDNYRSGQIDNTYGYSLGLNYLFRKWMKMKLGFEYQDKSSTAKSAIYKYNRYFFGTEMAF